MCPRYKCLLLAQGIYREHGYSHLMVLLDAQMQEVYVSAYTLDACGIMRPKSPDQLLSYREIQLPLPTEPVCLVSDVIHVLGKNCKLKFAFYSLMNKN